MQRRYRKSVKLANKAKKEERSERELCEINTRDITIIMIMDQILTINKVITIDKVLSGNKTLSMSTNL